MASFRKYKTSKGEVRHRAEIRMRGVKPYSKSFIRLSDAKVWAKKQDEITQCQAAGIQTIEYYTVAQAVERFYAECLPQRNKRVASRLLMWWKTELGERYLHTIRPAELIGIRNKLLKEPKKRSKKGFKDPVPCFDKKGNPVFRKPKTVQDYLDQLSTLYNKAIKEWEWVSVNPVQNVKKLKIQNERNRYLSDHYHLWPGEDEPRHWDELSEYEQLDAVTKFPRAYELPRLINALLGQRSAHKLQNSNPMLAYYLFVIQLGAGLRLSEATHMAWEENDLVEHPIVIVDLKREVLLLKSTKCDASPRMKPLCQEAFVVLKKLYAERRYDTPLVFPNSAGSAPFKFERRICRAITDAGLEDFRWHDLRHTTASYLSMMGAGQKEIMEALHHKSLKASQRYQHLSDTHLRGLLNRLGTTVLTDKHSPSRF